MLAGPSGPSESQRQAAVKAVTPSYKPSPAPAPSYRPPARESVAQSEGRPGTYGSYGRNRVNRRFGPSPGHGNRLIKGAPRVYTTWKGEKEVKEAQRERARLPRVREVKDQPYSRAEVGIKGPPESEMTISK